MSNPTQTLLWVSISTDVDRTQLEAACRELGITLRACAPDELDRALGPDVSMIGIEFDPQGATNLRLLERLRESHPHLPVFVASTATDLTVMRAALQHGATDFLALPLNPLDLSRVLIRIGQESGRTQQRAAAGEVFVVYGCRGGLGTTTLAVNLAVQLQRAGLGEVALVDLDLQRGDVAAFLNLNPAQSIAGLAETRSEIDEIFLHSLMTRHGAGLFVLAAPDQIEDTDAVGHDEVVLALRLLRSQYRYTVVDTPRSIGASTIAAFEQADMTLLLTDRSVPGIRAAQRTVGLLERLDVPRAQMRLLLTEAHAGPVSIEDAERTIGLRSFATIPRDTATAAQAMNTGTPLNGTRGAGLSAAVGSLADQLTGGRAHATKRGGLLRRFFTREAPA